MPRFPSIIRPRQSDRFEDKPLFLGFGPTKTGTSTTYHYLASHPEFFAPIVKEMQVFSAHFHSRNRKLYQKRVIRYIGLLLEDPKLPDTPWLIERLSTLSEILAMYDDPDRYMAFFRRNVGAEHKAFGELSPGYCGINVEGLRFIKSRHPSVKLLLTLRDPLDRVDAVLRHNWKAGRRIPYEEFFTDNLATRLQAQNFHYDQILERIFSVFSEEDVLIQFFEDMFVQTAFDELADFIGIASHPADPNAKFGHSPAPPSEEITDRYRALAAKELAPVYRYCRNRFGGRLPDSWANV